MRMIKGKYTTFNKSTSLYNRDASSWCARMKIHFVHTDPTQVPSTNFKTSNIQKGMIKCETRYMFKNTAHIYGLFYIYIYIYVYIYPADVQRDVACDTMNWYSCNGRGREINANFLWMPSSLLISLGEIEFPIRESYCNLSLIKVKYYINKGEKERKLQYQQDPVT
jgi:hypothetical protein